GIKFWPQWLTQVTWSSPRTNKFLLEGGMSAAVSNWQSLEQAGTSWQQIGIMELSQGFFYNGGGSSAGSFITSKDERITGRFAASYATGTHLFKTGLQLEHLSWRQQNPIVTKLGFNGATLGNVTYTFNNGTPISLTEFATPFDREDDVKAD